jgi:hypothetical protein
MPSLSSKDEVLGIEETMTHKKNQALLDSLSGDEALRVLRSLCASDATMRERVLAEARKVLTTIDPEDIAGEVFLDLESLDVDDVYAHSGASRDGYSSPDEVAAQMFEDALQPYSDQMDKYRKLGMVEQSSRYLMGILKGIYLFDHEAKSEFKEVAADIPGECFALFLDEWRKQADKRGKQEMKAFVSSECPEWAARSMED